MIVNQWTQAAHRGDAIGDHTRAFRDLVRSLGHESEIYALTIDPDLVDEIRPWSDPDAKQGDVTIFHFVMPSVMTAAFTTLPGARVLQYHNITPAHFFAPFSPGIARLTIRAPRSSGRSPTARTWRSATRATTARNSIGLGSATPGSCRSSSTPIG